MKELLILDQIKKIIETDKIFSINKQEVEIIRQYLLPILEKEIENKSSKELIEYFKNIKELPKRKED